ncbi:PREDICTED: protein tyrosine phosphatase type IVA 3 [Myotis davidii]|uniref:protein tyrosine phosphatase type IVA 3 n=1 Tax=Myotis davidii TaxID=225400 RepID=UPI000767DBC8|nr:PREDICTED: protein tyrosine phosphatase type IVA 3 [Myotis davidii]
MASEPCARPASDSSAVRGWLGPGPPLGRVLRLLSLQDWPFDDGAPPPGKVVEDWLSLLKAKFCDDPGSCVAVHCVAGLGRAPVLVALALIESGMKYEDAIQFIRQKRRGAINSKQLTYLEKYRPKQRLRFKEPHAHRTKCCVM